MKVLVVDYGMGNLGSVKRSLEECGADVVLSDDPRSLTEQHKVVLPGVGSFADGVRQLHQRGWTSALKEAIASRRVALLGICLGMQLLADRGEEGGVNAGLGLIPGEVLRLPISNAGFRVPHMGWNEVNQVTPHLVWTGIPDRADFYFVHSYRFVARSKKTVLAVTTHGEPFASAVGEGLVVGTQFHPEKSSRPGLRFLKNFLSLGSDA